MSTVTTQTSKNKTTTRHTARSVKEGIGYGLIAGVIFALMEVIASTIMGNPAITPFRLFASVLVGSEALTEMEAGNALLLGSVVHLVLSAAFGLVYGLIGASLTRRAQVWFGAQAGLGIAFGLALWLINFQLIARAAYPWFLETPQLMQALIHALFYGLPLGLMYAASERRAPASQTAAYAAS